jgi:2-dehydro-3-deoxy-D-arabinonate dehydratase
LQIQRLRGDDGQVRLGLLDEAGALAWLDQHTLAELLRLTSRDLQARLRDAPGYEGGVPKTVLAPIDGDMEVWAAGVTYRRSEEARVEESDTPDIYSRVYAAERPELFFKANARRVAGPDEPIVVRADSTWDVPEPELALVVNSRAEIVGYTVANDVSSRSIEGENPLYLPQAKVYARSCALGPGIKPAWEVPDPYALQMRMQILRNGQVYWTGSATTGDLKRRLDELVAYLFREDEFPDGVILSTGTALVPEAPFSLQQGDVVEIEIDTLGQLRNPVVCGKAQL